MLKEKADNLKLKHLKHVFKPLTRGYALKPESYIDVGFDTEYTSEDDSSKKTLLSLQFSLGRGHSAIYYVNKRGGITSSELFDCVKRFLREQGVETKKSIYLIVYFGLAELSCISDFYEAYDAPEGYKVYPNVNEFNKIVLWERVFYEISAERKWVKTVLHIRDLCGLARGGLDSVGSSFGFGKIPLDYDGHDDQYWKEHMDELLVKHPARFKEYAIRDAEITVEAWRSFVETYKPLNLDPHRKYTCSALAIAAFQRQMKKLSCPTAEEKSLRHKWMKAGYWKDIVTKQVVFNGSMDARVYAVYSYWGGHNEAFAVGYFAPRTEITQWDVRSLYIIAGILQPLSNCDTAYKEVSLQEVVDGAEGFCKVDFEFLPDTLYPILPIKVSYYDELMFPLRGSSYCTLTEIRQALALGVKITAFKGYGFMPTANEINSELGTFFIDMLAKKTALEEADKKNSSEYMNEKAMMVGTVGKFAQMNEGSTAGDIFHLIRESGLEREEFRKYGRKQAMRDLYTKNEVGGTWAIEWASLILGKARSIAAQLINTGRCLAISTDGGFWLGNPHLDECDIAKEMVKFHSGIRREDVKKPIDEFWVGRNRGYVAWSKGEAVYVAQGGIATRGHNSKEKKENFANMVRDQVEAGRLLITEQECTRLTGFKDFLHNGTSLCSKVHKILKCNWAYDGKRKLDSDINVFAENTWTKPYLTVEDAYRTKHGVSKSGRPRGCTLLTHDEIAEIKGSALTERQLAEKYDVDKSTIHRARFRLRKDMVRKRPLL